MRISMGGGWMMDRKRLPEPFTKEQIDSIDKDKFCRYEAFRQTGIANMFDLPIIICFTHLLKDEIQIIICHYDAIKRRYHDEELIKHYKESFDDKTERVQDIFLENV